MEQQMVIAKNVVVNSAAHDGYRRAGMALKAGENILEAGALTCSQLAMLKADPRLAVSYPEADTADSTPGAVVQGSLSDGVTGEEVKQQITLISAISQLDPENPAHFTTSNKPQVDVLEKLTGQSVTASERDDAWADYQQSQVEQAAQE